MYIIYKVGFHEYAVLLTSSSGGRLFFFYFLLFEIILWRPIILALHIHIDSR